VWVLWRGEMGYSKWVLWRGEMGCSKSGCCGEERWAAVSVGAV